MATETKVRRTTETHGKQRWTGESIVDFVKRRLTDDPPAMRGTKPKAASKQQSPTLRDVRLYFPMTKSFPDGIEVGGHEVYRVSLDGSMRMHNFVSDLSADQLHELECYANDRQYLTAAERREQRLNAQKRRAEVTVHGVATTTASKEEKALEALRRLPDLSAEQKRKVMDAILLESEAK